VLHCVALRCSVLQCVAACRMSAHSFVGIQILALSHERIMPLLHTCDVTPSYVRHASFICEMWLIHTWGMIHSHVRHASFIRVTCLIHMCAMTPSYVWHDSSICETRIIHICDMTHLNVWHDSFERVVDPFICVIKLIFTWNISETPHPRLRSHMATLWQVQF